jgi:hypothetical protein
VATKISFKKKELQIKLGNKELLEFWSTLVG